MAFVLPSLVSRRCLTSAANGKSANARQLFSHPTLKPFSTSGSRFASTTSRNFPSPIWRALHEAGQNRPSLSFVTKGIAVAGVGIGLSTLRKEPVFCDAPPPPKATDSIYPDDRPPPPVSSVSLYELSFGTVVGLCAGVFVKKGAKAVAWFLGGVFVLLQYMGSASLVRVDWNKAASKFENLFYTKDAAGGTRPPNVLSLWNWMIDFLTADFQPRASFVAGFVLGLRIG
ncbi:FUN14 domain-containing protein 1 [Psilocybe cubensis]|uniref:FUN14 family protein n=2 Tax=Psilocybe cubensis TaxID=181762 RepID=A0A8H8CNC8_PSICU|nr:FUN14 domain-containing protein 1 [Psilocybe cubensis]KAH9484235.1 FUN14 domain-containing protein 1 [Psilocybe cubensis]